jgi:hypothetical protein
LLKLNETQWKSSGKIRCDTLDTGTILLTRFQYPAIIHI